MTHHLHHCARIRQAPQRAVARPLLLLLLVVVMSATQTRAQTTAGSSTPGLTIGPTNIADTGYYYYQLRALDDTIFAGSTAIVDNGTMDTSSVNYVQGSQTLYSIPGAPPTTNTAFIPNGLFTAYRADALSEVMVSMAVMFLESVTALPFARTEAIPATYLPSTYTDGTSFVNPAYPSVPITLNMLLSHTSSITETGFSLGAGVGPTGTVPTLTDFVGSLFPSATTAIFSTTLQPGLSSSYAYSRNNVAILSYIVERILAGSTDYATYSSIGDFLFAVVLPPLGLTNTFLLNRNGTYVVTTYPATGTSTVDYRPYKAVQDITTDGTGVLGSFPTHASYFSDYMLYTCTADLTKLASEVFIQNGMYYSSIGTRMLSTAQNITSSRMLYANGRTPGLFRFDPNLLCAMLYAAVNNTGRYPYCYFSESSIESGSAPFGLVATGGTSELALICIPLASSRRYCSVAQLSFYETSATWPAGDATAAGNRAVGFAMVNIARFASDQQPTTTPAPTQRPPAVVRLVGWYIFAGVAAALIVVVAAAFCADYFIQPAPPAKIVAPVLTGASLGFRGGLAGTRNAAGAGDDHDDGHSDRDGEESENGDEDDSDQSPKNVRDTATTSTLTSSGGDHHGHTRHPAGGPAAAAATNDGGRQRNGGYPRSTPQRQQHRQQNGRRRHDFDSDEDDNDAAGADVTPHVLRSSSRHGDSSLRRRRRHRQQQEQAGGGWRGGGHQPAVHQSHRGRYDDVDDNMTAESSGDEGYSSPDDGWGERQQRHHGHGHGDDRSSTGSQRPNPHGMLRFDAYI